MLFGGCLLASLMSKQSQSVSQGLVFKTIFTYCHTEIEVAEPTYLTQSQYSDTKPTISSSDPTMLGAEDALFDPRQLHGFMVITCV